jgi:hypothetical protein
MKHMSLIAATAVLLLLAARAPLAQAVCDPAPPSFGLRCDVWVTLDPPVSVEKALDIACRHGLRIQYAKTTFPAPPGGLPMHSTHRVLPGQSADSLRTEWTYGFVRSQTHNIGKTVEKMRAPSPRMDAATRANFQRMADQMESRAAWAQSLDPDSLASTLTVEKMSGVVYGRRELVRELGEEAVGDGLCFPWVDAWPFTVLYEPRSR